MLKISDLQSQVSLNRSIIRYQEFQVNLVQADIDFLKNQKERYPEDKDVINLDLSHSYRLVNFYKKKIKQYAKLQRALEDELAYRIRYNRAMREIEAITLKAAVEGWEVVASPVIDYNNLFVKE